ncbi:MAG: RAD55 family ATPase [Candidatus Kariarchaeaceae archaeon]|jgi:KaiC/GvpD/RAD55 family RecA-like ATPase
MAKKKTKRASFYNNEEDQAPPSSQSTFPPDELDQIPSGIVQAPQEGSDQFAMFSQMMQSFQSMMNLGAIPQQWSSSQPFQAVETSIEPEAVSHDIIFPKTIERGIIAQEALNIHPLFSKLFIHSDGSPLGGIPRGCTITLTGPAYSGKTRSALEMIIHSVQQGIKVAYVVAEEGFYDTSNAGRNDLFSRFLKLATEITGMTEKAFRKKYDDLYIIIPNQYHLGKSWSDFIKDYRYAVEELECNLTIIDSINMLDPSKLNTVDNLNALKTYNHEKGATCIVIGQVKDSGVPQGGEALYHSSEVSIHIYEKTMTSKDLAASWGANYRDIISLISARSKVCSTLNFSVKIIENDLGLVRASPDQPADNEFPDDFWE